MKRFVACIAVGGLLFLGGCAPKQVQQGAEPSVTLTLAAAASLENAFVQRLIPMFEEQYGYITVQGAFDSSGKLQTQIEEGLMADLFLSAAMKQMNALADAGLVEAESVVKLLENKVVLIKPTDGQTAVTGFETILDAEMIAIGDPDSVPAGQYAREVFMSLGSWDAVLSRASLGSNVTEVLSWVAAGSAEVGVVYATDAASNDRVQVIAQAPEGTLQSPVLYPAGLVASTEHRAAAELFLQFLQSSEAMTVFEAYGFAPIM